MNEIAKYHIFSSKEYIELCNEITQAIEDSWQPLGGVSTTSVIDPTTGKISSMFFQAVVQYKEETSRFKLG